MAGFTDTAKDTGLDAIGTAAVYLSLHTADPGTTGANEVTGGTYARVATTWAAAASSLKTGSQVTINVPGGTTIAYAGLWTALTGGTFYTGAQLPNPQTYASAGTYNLTPNLSAAG